VQEEVKEVEEVEEVAGREAIVSLLAMPRAVGIR